MSKIFQAILRDCGIQALHSSPVSGGDINQAYCIVEKGRKSFLKLNDAGRYPGMFRKEAKGLELLKSACGLTVPAVYKSGETFHTQYLLIEWLDRGQAQPDFSVHFGRELARLHQQPQAYFGFEEDNFIGSLPQENTRWDSWHDFYAHCRILPLSHRLHRLGSFSVKDITLAEKLSERFKDIFPDEPPALLHGDLWSGNYLISSDGFAAIFDPAVYFGHREMDIGMSKLFGGFVPGFYEAYHEYYPLETGWQERTELSQLYPILVHAIIFGGHYVRSASEIMEKYA